MAFRQILFEKGENGIATLILNRPTKLNALNAEVMDEIGAAVRLASEDAGVRALLVTGAGEKAFVAGADIAEFAGLDEAAMRALAERGQGIFGAIEAMGKPSIAAVNGYALGGGLELAMACTVRVASSNAKMGLPEARLGLMPGYGGSVRLPRLVGHAKALELMLTGDAVDAAEALRIGLVNHVVEREVLIPFCTAMLERMLANAPASIRAIMEVAGTGLAAESQAFGKLGASADAAEGIAAFLEKRKPVFTGN